MSTRPARFDPDDAWRARNGREFPFTTIGDWVLLAGVSSRAVHVYCLLRMHVHATRENGKAWPSQGTLAAMVGIRKYDAIAAAIRELVELGAVEVETEVSKDGRRNTYTVHQSPPVDYPSPTSRTAWYDARGLL